MALSPPQPMTPQKDVVQVRTFTLDRSPKSTQELRLNEIAAATLDIASTHTARSETSWLALDQPSPLLSPVAPMSRTPSRTLQPNGLPLVTNGTGSPHPTSPPTPSPLSGGADGDNSEAGPWTPTSKATSAGGKSGRVIERLMGEVDRLTRDLKLATVRYEEEQRRSESAREALESLRVSNGNLEAICDTTRAALDRKDRRIEHLRTSLEREQAARTEAQDNLAVVSRRADEEARQRATETHELRERTQLAETRYEALHDSVSRMEQRYGSQVERLRQEFGKLQKQQTLDQRRFEALDEICAQLRADFARAQEANKALVARHEAYKDATEDEVGEIRRVVGERERVIEETRQAMEEVTGGMRYVMNLRTHLKEDGGGKGD